jgi:hypothetical protein
MAQTQQCEGWGGGCAALCTRERAWRAWQASKQREAAACHRLRTRSPRRKGVPCWASQAQRLLRQRRPRASAASPCVAPGACLLAHAARATACAATTTSTACQAMHRPQHRPALPCSMHACGPRGHTTHAHTTHVAQLLLRLGRAAQQLVDERAHGIGGTRAIRARAHVAARHERAQRHDYAVADRAPCCCVCVDPRCGRLRVVAVPRRPA